MATFGSAQVNVADDAGQLLQTLRNNFAQEPGLVNVLARIGNGEFGKNLTLDDTISALSRLLEPDQFQRLMSGASSPAGGNLETMSDNDLLSLAQQHGIDTAPFTVQPGGVESALQDVSGLQPVAPTATMPFDVNRDQVFLPQDVQNEVAQVFGSQRQLGQQELARQAVELAGQRGLSIGDADIPQRVAQQLATMEGGLRSSEANTLLSLAEQARQNQLQQRMFGANLGEGARQFNANNLLQQRGLGLQGLLGRGSLLENRRQFENQFGLQQQTANRNFLTNMADFQNRLRQQAFTNRLALSGQAGTMGLGLANARSGINTGFSQFNPALASAQTTGGLRSISEGTQGLTPLLQSIGGFLGF